MIRSQPLFLDCVKHGRYIPDIYEPCSRKNRRVTHRIWSRFRAAPSSRKDIPTSCTRSAPWAGSDHARSLSAVCPSEWAWLSSSHLRPPRSVHRFRPRRPPLLHPGPASPRRKHSISWLLLIRYLLVVGKICPLSILIMAPDVVLCSTTQIK